MLDLLAGSLSGPTALVAGFAPADNGVSQALLAACGVGLIISSLRARRASAREPFTAALCCAVCAALPLAMQLFWLPPGARR